MTYNYAKTILGLMTRVKDDKGKVSATPAVSPMFFFTHYTVL